MLGLHRFVPKYPLVLNGFLYRSSALGEVAVLDLPSVFAYFICNSSRRPGMAMNLGTPHARRRRLMLGMKPFRERPGTATPGSGPSSPGRA